MRFCGMAELRISIDPITIPAPHPLDLEIALSFQVSDYPLSRSLSYPNIHRNVSNSRLRVLGEIDQDMAVV